MQEPLLLDALVAASAIDANEPDQVARLRQKVAERAERLDDQAFDAQEAWDRGEVGRDVYLSAFRAARAATSVLRALEQPAVLAAAEACYETFHALDAPQAEDALLEIARRELGV